jgi:hypothetical protein
MFKTSLLKQLKALAHSKGVAAESDAISFGINLLSIIHIFLRDIDC